MDLQHQPEGADVWVSFQGSGILQCYLIPSSQFGAFAKGDAVDCFQFDVAPPQHAVQIPHEGLWHVVMRGVGEAEVTVSPSARLDASVRAILQPEKHQDPTPDPGAPDLAQLPLHAGSGPAAENPPLPSGQAGWQELLVPSVGMDQKRLDFLRENFFFDNVYPTSVSTSRNAVGSVITAQMSDGSTFEQWIADPGPMLPGLSSSTPVLSPEQRISMARVKDSPLFGDSKLLPDGTVEPENPWYLDLLEGLDFVSWAMLILPGVNLAGAAGKVAIAAAKRAVAKVIERNLERKAKGAAIKAAATKAAEEAVMYAAAGKAFSAADLGIFKEAAQIYRSPKLNEIRKAFASGKEAGVEIGEYSINYAPGLPAAGMSLTAYGKAFVVGPEAFTSELEFARTIAQESYRVATLSGTASPELASKLTKLAEEFARKAGPILIGGGK